MIIVLLALDFLHSFTGLLIIMQYLPQPPFVLFSFVLKGLACVEIELYLVLILDQCQSRFCKIKQISNLANVYFLIIRMKYLEHLIIFGI